MAVRINSNTWNNIRSNDKMNEVILYMIYIVIGIIGVLTIKTLIKKMINR